MEELNDKQKRFCEEYITDLNGTQAAIRAGYSKDSAKEIAYEHLTKPHLQEYITQLKKERSDRLKVEADFVLEKLINLATFNISDFAEFDGYRLRMKADEELTREQLACIESIKPTKFGVEVKFHNKLQALDMINKHIGFYEKDNSQKVPEQDLSKLSIEEKLQLLNLLRKTKNG